MMLKKWIFSVVLMALFASVQGRNAVIDTLSEPLVAFVNEKNKAGNEMLPALLPVMPVEPLQYASPLYNADAVIFSDPVNTSFINVLEMIRGRVAGVWMAGGPNYYQVRIRGAMGPPVVVIDNMPFYSASDSEMSNLLQIIVPQDVDRIEIIKNAAGAAIYGRNAGNGVILIYTKKG